MKRVIVQDNAPNRGAARASADGVPQGKAGTFQTEAFQRDLLRRYGSAAGGDALCLAVDMMDGIATVIDQVVASDGRVLDDERSVIKASLDDALLEIARSMVSRTGGVTAAALGLPAYLMQGRVLDSDVLSAVGSELARTLSRELGIPVSVDNDMYFKALGFSQSSEGRGGTVTLFNALRDVMPGSATVCEGVVYRGASGFAGVLDMLPFGLDTQSVVEMLGSPVTAQPYLAFVMRSLIASMNPGRFIITGSLVDAEAVRSLEASVAKTVPTWAMPEFVYRPSFERWYLDGLVSWLQQGAGAGA